MSKVLSASYETGLTVCENRIDCLIRSVQKQFLSLQFEKDLVLRIFVLFSFIVTDLLPVILFHFAISLTSSIKAKIIIIIIRVYCHRNLQCIYKAR